MGIFQRTKEIAYFRAIYNNYDVYAEKGLKPEAVIIELLSSSPQTEKKPFLGFDEESIKEFSKHFLNTSHDQAKIAICNMAVFGIKQKVNVSDYSGETISQFLESAAEQVKEQ